jgi:hypothetical protein
MPMEGVTPIADVKGAALVTALQGIGLEPWRVAAVVHVVSLLLRVEAPDDNADALLRKVTAAMLDMLPINVEISAGFGMETEHFRVPGGAALREEERDPFGLYQAVGVDDVAVMLLRHVAMNLQAAAAYADDSGIPF